MSGVESRIEAELARRMAVVLGYLYGDVSRDEYAAQCETRQPQPWPVQRRKRKRNRQAERERARRYRARMRERRKAGADGSN